MEKKSGYLAVPFVIAVICSTGASSAVQARTTGSHYAFLDGMNQGHAVPLYGDAQHSLALQCAQSRLEKIENVLNESVNKMDTRLIGALRYKLNKSRYELWGTGTPTLMGFVCDGKTQATDGFKKAAEKLLELESRVCRIEKELEQK